MGKIKSNRIIITTAYIGLLSLLFVIKFWKDEPNTNLSYNHFLESDGGGYYNYLPSIFIRHDFGNDTTCENFVYKTENGHTINKYFVGTALMSLPFYVLAYIDSYPQYDVIDGKNYIMQRDVSLAALFYFILGCYFTMRWLAKKFKNDLHAIVALFVTLLSNSLFYYITYEPFYSHAFSFFLIAYFISKADDYFENHHPKSLIKAVITLGFIFLVRPTNILIILLIPAIAGTSEKIKSAIKFLFSQKKLVFKCFAYGLSILSVQPILNYIQCGNFFEWSYKNEGFIFSQPKLFQLFFSFEGGIFIWLPVFICSIIALAILFRKNKFQAITLTLFLFINFYVYASWWAITYGDSMILRPYTDFTTLTAFLNGIFLFSITKPFLKNIAKLFIGICMLYNIKIFYQFSTKIIHLDRMNKEKFIYTFDKLGEDYKECLGGIRITGLYTKNEPECIISSFDDFEKDAQYFINNNPTPDTLNYNNHCLSFDQNEFNTGFVVENNKDFYKANYTYAAIQLKRKEPFAHSSKDALIVVHITYPHKSKQFYYTIKLNELPQENAMVWREWNYSIELPKIINPNYKLTIYVWNIAKQKFYIDDVSIKIYKVN